MTIIACIDPRFGLSVDGKRQTTDTRVIQDILSEIEDQDTGLTVTESSARYILSCVNPVINNIPLNVVNEIKPNQHEDATIFIETAPVKLIHKLISRADRIVLYIWDVTYTHYYRCLVTAQSENGRHQETWRRPLFILAGRLYKTNRQGRRSGEKCGKYAYTGRYGCRVRHYPRHGGSTAPPGLDDTGKQEE